MGAKTTAEADLSGAVFLELERQIQAEHLRDDDHVRGMVLRIRLGMPTAEAAAAEGVEPDTWREIEEQARQELCTAKTWEQDSHLTWVARVWEAEAHRDGHTPWHYLARRFHETAGGLLRGSDAVELAVRWCFPPRLPVRIRRRGQVEARGTIH